MKAGPLDRALVVVLGLYLAGTGGVALWRGRWLYTDYLGLRVLSPLALLTGIALVLLGTAFWRRAVCGRRARAEGAGGAAAQR